MTKIGPSDGGNNGGGAIGNEKVGSRGGRGVAFVLGIDDAGDAADLCGVGFF